MKNLNFHKQKSYPVLMPIDIKDCGPTCMLMIAQYFNKEFEVNEVRTKISDSDYGASFLILSEAAEQLGLNPLCMIISMGNLIKIKSLPFICHWNKSHFVVVYELSRRNVLIGDPGSHLKKITLNQFRSGWCNNPKIQEGYVLLFRN